MNLHMEIESKFICVIPKLETTRMSFGELMIKELVMCLDSEPLFNNKRAWTINIQTAWMNCKEIILTAKS